ncbi:hypothetical protein Thu_240 [Bacillus phage Thurquoise]|uniref:Uncharacterized protein n=1 Tax=Bacillus phage Deep Blue TaxID=1792245 RepID=A0A140HLK2_9CAUD|nr:hypothetical protein Blue_041 [Bacillus phage Deep Blue]AMO25864.1 hypothetical protein Blue_041 [Bacillus phage Deep Blue]UXQ89083.1 hypothetical protein Thu_240 [Bacillus phage Thurquoise]
MKYFLFKLLGVLTIGTGGFIVGYAHNNSIYTVLGSIACYFVGQLFYDKAFKHREDK